MNFIDEEKKIIEEMISICKKHVMYESCQIFLYIRIGQIVHSDCFFKYNREIYELHELINSSQNIKLMLKIFGDELISKNIELNDLYKSNGIIGKEENKSKSIEIKVVFDGKDYLVSKEYDTVFKSFMGVDYYYNQWFECEKYKCTLENGNVKSFESEVNSWIVDMIDICNEYSLELSENIYIYINRDDYIYSNHGYKINEVKYTKETIEKSGASDDFDVSENIFEQIEEILDNDYRKIEVLFDYFERDIPKQIFINYDVKNKKLKTDFKYNISENPIKTYQEFLNMKK